MFSFDVQTSRHRLQIWRNADIQNMAAQCTESLLEKNGQTNNEIPQDITRRVKWDPCQAQTQKRRPILNFNFQVLVNVRKILVPALQDRSKIAWKFLDNWKWQLIDSCKFWYLLIWQIAELEQACSVPSGKVLLESGFRMRELSFWMRRQDK